MAGKREDSHSIETSTLTIKLLRRKENPEPLFRPELRSISLSLLILAAFQIEHIAVFFHTVLMVKATRGQAQ